MLFSLLRSHCRERSSQRRLCLPRYLGPSTKSRDSQGGGKVISTERLSRPDTVGARMRMWVGEAPCLSGGNITERQMSGYREHGHTEKETEGRKDTSAETGGRVYVEQQLR